MALFKRKEDEDLEDDEDLIKEEEKENKKFKKKFKDLKPVNKKKRKEPPKPWGKKERLTILVILIVTILVPVILSLPARDFKLSGLPRLSIDLNNFSLRNLFGEKTIEIGQPGHFESNDENAKEAIDLFNHEVKPVSGLYGFYVVRLDNGSNYGVSDNEKFQGASLLKLPLLAILYKEADEGKINLDSRYILKNSDKVKGSGTIDMAAAGTVYTYRQLAELMANESDRTAYKIIKNILGDTAFNNFLSDQGMINTSLSTGETTPKDMGLLLQNLYQGKIVSDKSKNEIFGFLSNTIYESWITAGVPKSVKVVHKFGQDTAVMADAGIIFTKSPYVLVIMGNGITQTDADKIFPVVSKDIYGIESGDN